MTSRTPYRALFLRTGNSSRGLHRLEDVAAQIASRIGLFANLRDCQLDEIGIREVGSKLELPRAAPDDGEPQERGHTDSKTLPFHE